MKEQYVGLDVSLKQTSICVVDRDGDVICEGKVGSEPEAIATFIREKAPNAARIGLETGPTSTWLWTDLHQLGLPIICIDARHAKAALSMQINKSDRQDAVGLARIMQCGWYKEVRVKSAESHAIRSLLCSRALLIKMRRDLENQIRGLLKNIGLVIGKAGGNVFTSRVHDLIDGKPYVDAVILPLLSARAAIRRELVSMERRVGRLARQGEITRSLMTTPGVGPITALAYRATIDDPTRFQRSRSAGAYLGLTTRRHVSGEVDWTGRISKRGDKMLRGYLFEAAGVLLCRTRSWSSLKAWGIKLWKRIGLSKAKVAVARKLAIVLHRIWLEKTDFQWSITATTAA